MPVGPGANQSFGGYGSPPGARLWRARRGWHRSMWWRRRVRRRRYMRL